MTADPNCFRECLTCTFTDSEPAFVHPDGAAIRLTVFVCPMCGSTDTLGLSDSPLLRGDYDTPPEPQEPA